LSQYETPSNVSIRVSSLESLFHVERAPSTFLSLIGMELSFPGCSWKNLRWEPRTGAQSCYAEDTQCHTHRQCFTKSVQSFRRQYLVLQLRSGRQHRGGHFRCARSHLLVHICGTGGESRLCHTCALLKRDLAFGGNCCRLLDALFCTLLPRKH